MCMALKFGCNPKVNFCHFFCSLNLYSHFLAQLLPKQRDAGYLVNVTPPKILASYF